MPEHCFHHHPIRMISLGESMIEMRQMADGSYRLGFAGDTLNTAYYAKLLLEQDDHVSYFTCVGDDIYSAQMLQFIAGNGIETKDIRIIKGKKPGLYMIHQEAGDRHFTYWREMSAARLLTEEPDRLEEALQEANLIYFSGITLGILTPTSRAKFFAMLQRSQNQIICFDPNIRPALWSDNGELKATLAQAASFCDIVLPTYGDEAALFGDESPDHMAQRYLENGAREVVVKNGAGVALARRADVRREAKPPLVERMIDATGAGDSFNAAYIAARIKGKPMLEAMQAGHHVAGAVIKQPGAIIDKNHLAQ